MVKIETELVQPLPEPEEGKTYTIKNVEYVTTQRMGYKGYRVLLEDTEGNEAATMLWDREQAGINSKLGSFLVVLGSDTDEWIGKRITFISWRQRARKIQLAPPS